jgi:Tol biopolymer transport system component
VGNRNEDFLWVDSAVIHELEKERFPRLTGPYLGERLPGTRPKIFAPHIISTDKDEINGVFSPDGREFYFSRDTYRNRSEAGKEYHILFSKQKNNKWTSPVTASFSGEYMDADMCFDQNGRFMIFCSDRPVGKNGKRKSDSDLWMVKKTASGWSIPEHLGFTVNSLKNEWYPCLTGNNTLYFSSSREGGHGSSDIYRSEYQNGIFQKPENIGIPVNSEFNENDIYVSPDETFLIVISSRRPDTLGSGDMYISFWERDQWTVPQNMGEPFNSSELEYCPMQTPDGKYLFFTSRRRGNDDIYWISTDIIQSYKKGGKK